MLKIERTVDDWSNRKTEPDTRYLTVYSTYTTKIYEYRDAQPNKYWEEIEMDFEEEENRGFICSLKSCPNCGDTEIEEHESTCHRCHILKKLFLKDLVELPL